MNRVKRYALQLLQSHRDKFGLQFEANKKALQELAVIPSKRLRNQVAGYITALLKKEREAEEEG